MNQSKQDDKETSPKTIHPWTDEKQPWAEIPPPPPKKKEKLNFV